MRLLATCLALLLGLAACAEPAYRLGERAYDSHEAALGAQADAIRRALNGIAPGDVTFPGRAVVFVPSRADIAARGLAGAGPGVDSDTIAVVAESQWRLNRAMGEAIERRALFESVEIREVVGTDQPEIGPDEHAVQLYLLGPAETVWSYFNATMDDAVEVPLDLSLPVGAVRTNAWLDLLEDAVAASGAEPVTR